MQHQQTIAGMDLPFDSFTVPAARRVVKAVMFTQGQAAMLLHGAASPGETAVLFAVDDQNDRPLPHAIALSAGGRPVRAGGLVLGGSVTSYPAVDVVAIPNIAVTALGVLLLVAGDRRARVLGPLSASIGRRRSRARFSGRCCLRKVRFLWAARRKSP